MLVQTTEIKITYCSCHLCVSVCSLGAIGGDLGKLWLSEFLPVENSRTNMTKVLSTRRWHDTNHPWEVLIFVLCHLRMERIFVVLVWLQCRNLNGRSPSCVLNELSEFMNRRFDLKNSFFSSTEIRSGTQNGIHWEEYSSARVLTWFYDNVLA